MSVVSIADDADDKAVLDGSRSAWLRERLLSASARASRLLLEAPDAMAAMPTILRELGEAAEVDRTAYAIAETDAGGASWLLIKSEWTAEYVVGERSNTVRLPLGDRTSDCFCNELSAGRSVYVRHGNGSCAISIASELAKSSLIVPFLVDGEYAGAIGFDDCREVREFDPAVVSALEIAASLIGAALHREKLVEAVRQERERAAEQRVAELARTNAILRDNLERLASAPDPYSFLGHMLVETARQLEAAAGAIVMLAPGGDEWRVMAHVREGVLEEPPFVKVLPHSDDMRADLVNFGKEPKYFEVDTMPTPTWPGMCEFQKQEGHKSIYKLPLVFGEQTVGFISLAFRRLNALDAERSSVLITLAQQATLAIGLKRLAISAKNAAVLAERNRISREIHDGLAQAFTGILMQLGAAEELAENSPLAVVLVRIRDIAREGLSEARRSVLALSPAESRPGGLELALRQLAERSTVDGRLSAIFEGGATPTGLVPEFEHALLRIAQEAVSNAARHSGAKQIRIGLIAEQTHMLLSVADDGCGMAEQPEQHAQQGFGLANMRERAEAIGGEWLIDSQRGRGTTISVRVARPLRA